MRPCIFLDRDGVINEVNLVDGKPHPPKNLEQLKILPGVNDSLVCLKNAGYLLIIVTNQPDVARGMTRKTTVEDINRFISNSLPIDDIYTCFHDANDHCGCRKPLPGAIISAKSKWDINIANSFMIGDRWKDVEAGIAAGCKTVFIDCKYNEKRPPTFDFKANDLQSATRFILEGNT